MAEKLGSYAGEPIVLETEVSRPNAVVKWWLNGSEIMESSNVTMTAEGLIHRLTIHSPTPEDSGKYSCDVIDDKMDFHVTVTGKNPGEPVWFDVFLSSQGPLASSEPPVKVLRKSEIKTELRFLESDDIVLECELSRATAGAKWYKNDSPVEGDERYCEEKEGAFHSLVILHAELEDSGKYLLDVGEDNISFDVTVEGRFARWHP